MLILTAHRKGELLKLKKENVIEKEKKIISPPEITKTQEEYHFPIPNECFEYIKNIDTGLLFPTLKHASVYGIFQRLLKIAIDIGDIELYKGKTISPHDMRRIMLHIMITKCNVDGMLADSCLSHKQKGSAKNYVDFSDENIREAYQKYWDILALTDKEYNDKYNKTQSLQHTSSALNNIDKLLKLEEMLGKGLLTEAEFMKHKTALNVS